MGENHDAAHALGYKVVQIRVLAIMFGGAWLSWPWFVFNGFVVGSPTRKKELALVLVGFAGNFVLSMGLGGLMASEMLPESAGP